jgi:hypothetical protein
LQGSWSGVVEVDDAQFRSDEKFKEVPSEQAELVLKIVKDQFSQMKIKLTFGEDGQSTATFDAPDVPEKDKTQTGTWEVVKSDGPNITVRITSVKEDGDGDEDDEEDEEEDEEEDSEEEDAEEEDAEDEEKAEVSDVTFRFADEKTMTATEMGDKLPKGVTFKFTKQ